MKRRTRTVSLSHGAPSMSDDALALEFAEANKTYVRLSQTTGSWMIWDGSRWRPDRSIAREAIRRLCRKAAAEAEADVQAVRLASAAKVMAVETLARSDTRLLVDETQWDANPWLLNTQGGVVDLRSGEVQPHDPDLLMSRIAEASPKEAAPLWNAFLENVTGGDADLQAYLQRVAGYCLTGTTREHAIFFLLGGGGNGKSVFTTVLRSVLGDYAATAASDLLTTSNFARHPTELAALRHVRLVLVPEVERRARFAESRMKSLTGGDEIAARLMRQDFSTFTPCFKLMLTGNRMPSLESVDEAVRRRLHIIPFGRSIPITERDPQLTEKLLRERDGILAWALEGCLAWQREGLDRPLSVAAASTGFLEDQDLLGQFISACCQTGPSHSVGSTDLFRLWIRWTQERAEQPGSQRAFVQELMNRGFQARRTSHVRILEGLRAKETPETPGSAS